MSTRLMIRDVVIVETKNTQLDWKQVNDQKSEIGWSLLLWLVIPFLKWQTVLAPKETSCAMKTLGGEPLYRYKIFKDKVYNLGQMPAPEY